MDLYKEQLRVNCLLLGALDVIIKDPKINIYRISVLNV